MSTRSELVAALNWAMRPGTVDEFEKPLVKDALLASTHHLGDLDRDVLAEHLLQALEGLLGPVESWPQIAPRRTR